MPITSHRNAICRTGREVCCQRNNHNPHRCLPLRSCRFTCYDAPFATTSAEALLSLESAQPHNWQRTEPRTHTAQAFAKITLLVSLRLLFANRTNAVRLLASHGQTGSDPRRPDRGITSGLPTIHPEWSHPLKRAGHAIIARTNGPLRRHQARPIRNPVAAAGGMGEVYRARDTRLAREAAIKVLPEAFEARKRLRHQRVATPLPGGGGPKFPH